MIQNIRTYEILIGMDKDDSKKLMKDIDDLIQLLVDTGYIPPDADPFQIECMLEERYPALSELWNCFRDLT